MPKGKAKTDKTGEKVDETPATPDTEAATGPGPAPAAMKTPAPNSTLASRAAERAARNAGPETKAATGDAPDGTTK